MAAVPKPDKAFGSIAPALDGLRRLYEQTDVAKRGLTDFAQRAYSNPTIRNIIGEMEEAGGELGRSGPGTYIKDMRHMMNNANDPNNPLMKFAGLKDQGTEMANTVINELANLWLGGMK
jgi:hypothetical protein